MINYLKAKNYRGISEIYLKNLGKINVLCGKNNSGKTSILQALQHKDFYAIGKKLKSENLSSLNKIFKEQGLLHSNIPSDLLFPRFNQYLYNKINEETVWYSDGIVEYIADFVGFCKKQGGFPEYGEKIDFDLEIVVKTHLEDCLEYYKPILIPPDRSLYDTVGINTNELLRPDGEGVINNLFFLKNQDIKSDEYGVYKEIHDRFFELTGCKFNIISVGDNQIKLNFNERGEEWIAANYCGLGLSDVLILLTIILRSDSGFVFIEEPENHLHAELCKKFLYFLRSVETKQFILSTHSNVFLNTSLVDRIYYTEYIDKIKITDETSKSKILNSLGYTVAENLVADVIILMEGPKDMPVFFKIFEWLDLIQKYNIRFWALGGDIMIQQDLTVFTETKKVFAVVDSDLKKERNKFRKLCKEHDIDCTVLKKYSIENYLTLNAIKRVFPGEIINIAELDPRKSVEKQLGFSIKRNLGDIIGYMTLDDIKGTDLHKFALSVKEFLDNSHRNTM